MKASIWAGLRRTSLVRSAGRRSGLAMTASICAALDGGAAGPVDAQPASSITVIAAIAERERAARARDVSSRMVGGLCLQLDSGLRPVSADDAAG
jgi:hypothetical protein